MRQLARYDLPWMTVMLLDEGGKSEAGLAAIQPHEIFGSLCCSIVMHACSRFKSLHESVHSCGGTSECMIRPFQH